MASSPCGCNFRGTFGKKRCASSAVDQVGRDGVVRRIEDDTDSQARLLDAQMHDLARSRGIDVAPGIAQARLGMLNEAGEAAVFIGLNSRCQCAMQDVGARALGEGSRAVFSLMTLDRP